MGTNNHPLLPCYLAGSAEQLSLALSHGSPDRHLDLINRRLATSLPSTRPLSSLLAQVR
jgi:hypothetical protein